jgi:sarcosine dehydrogenase
MKKGDFIGRPALEQRRAEAAKRKLCVFLLDGDKPVYGSEAILRDGKVVGVTSSAGYGHTIGKWIAFGYLPSDETAHADYEIEAFTQRVPARRIDGSAYDPERKRILA